LFWIFLIISKKSKSTAAVTIFLKTNLLGFRNIGPLVIGFYIFFLYFFFLMKARRQKKNRAFPKNCCSVAAPFDYHMQKSLLHFPTQSLFILAYK
jgi:uncharacterized BrkB/YihY/UPF0761 family membrane protein